MKKALIPALLLAFAAASFAGFKGKTVKPKPPEKFQAHAIAEGITVAADLLITEKEQTAVFAQPLNPIKVVLLRLAIFNGSSREVFIPIEDIRLIGPDGSELPVVSPEEVAEAAIRGAPVAPPAKEDPVKVAAGPKVIYSPRDPDQRGYDPRLDPQSPSYDPNDPRNRRSGSGRVVPGIDVVLNPGGSSSGNSEEFDRELRRKDFIDKAYLADPVLPSMKRDRFLYYSMENPPAVGKGFKLHLSRGKGLPQEMVLSF